MGALMAQLWPIGMPRPPRARPRPRRVSRSGHRGRGRSGLRIVWRIAASHHARRRSRRRCCAGQSRRRGGQLAGRDPRTTSAHPASAPSRASPMHGRRGTCPRGRWRSSRGPHRVLRRTRLQPGHVDPARGELLEQLEQPTTVVVTLVEHDSRLVGPRGRQFPGRETSTKRSRPCARRRCPRRGTVRPARSAAIGAHGGLIVLLTGGQPHRRRRRRQGRHIGGTGQVRTDQPAPAPTRDCGLPTAVTSASVTPRGRRARR